MNVAVRSKWSVAVVVAVLLGTSSYGAAADGGHGRSELTVMTQNLYLGSSLAPALVPGLDGPGFVAAVAQIYGTMLFTDFPKCAATLADTIAAEEPGIIALQEVSQWTTTVTHAGPTPPPLIDFLTELQRELDAHGLDYVVASEARNATIGPAPLVAPRFGCLPFIRCVPDCLVTLVDRDVILVNRRTEGLTWSDARRGTFKTQQVVTLPDGTEVSFDRGWTTIEASFEGRRFRFLDTHLETEDFPEVQEKQTLELLVGPLLTLKTVIAAGDFNSAADGSTTDSYRLLRKFLLRDAWRAGRCDVLSEQHVDERRLAARHSHRPHHDARHGVVDRGRGAAQPGARRPPVLGIGPRRCRRHAPLPLTRRADSCRWVDRLAFLRAPVSRPTPGDRLAFPGPFAFELFGGWCRARLTGTGSWAGSCIRFFGGGSV